MSAQGHWFWWLLTVASMLWYTVITAYVAVKGAFDIQHKLARLSRQNREGS